MDERTKQIMQLVLDWYVNTEEMTTLVPGELVDLVDRLVKKFSG